MAKLDKLLRPKVKHEPIPYPVEFSHTIPSTPVWINANLTLNVKL